MGDKLFGELFNICIKHYNCKPQLISCYVLQVPANRNTKVLTKLHRYTWQDIEEVCRSRFWPSAVRAEAVGSLPTSVFIEDAYLLPILLCPFFQRVQSMFGIETPLSALLIKPVQRITKYPLLLKVRSSPQMLERSRADFECLLSILFGCYVCTNRTSYGECLCYCTYVDTLTVVLVQVQNSLVIHFEYYCLRNLTYRNQISNLFWDQGLLKYI